MVLKKLTELGKRMHKHWENFRKETENITKYQTGATEQKKTTELKTKGFNSRLDKAEERNSDLEENTVTLPKTEQQKENKAKKKKIKFTLFIY